MKGELATLRATYDHKLRELQQRIAEAGQRGHPPVGQKQQPQAAEAQPVRIPDGILRRLFKIINDRI